MIPEDFQGKIPSVSLCYNSNSNPSNENKEKCKYRNQSLISKIETEFFYNFTWRRNVKSTIEKNSKFMQIFRLRKYPFDGYPYAKEAGSGNAQPGGSGQEGRVYLG